MIRAVVIVTENMVVIIKLISSIIQLIKCVIKSRDIFIYQTISLIFKKNHDVKYLNQKTVVLTQDPVILSCNIITKLLYYSLNDSQYI